MLGVWFGFGSDGFSESVELWGWDPWEPQAQKSNGEPRGENLCTYCMPGRWDYYTQRRKLRGEAMFIQV